MTVPDIEIPLVKDRKIGYRLLEILPGFLTWTVLLMPFVLAFVNPTLLAVLVIGYLIIWFIRSIALNLRVSQSYRQMRAFEKINWQPLIADLDNAAVMAEKLIVQPGGSPEWHVRNVVARAQRESEDSMQSRDVLHVVIIPSAGEQKETLEATIKNIIDTHFPSKQMILVLAPEMRAGDNYPDISKDLATKYKDHFYHTMTVPHPPELGEGEVIGKGGNITYAAWKVKDYLDQKGIAYERAIVTTLDADNRPSVNYFSEVTYLFLASSERQFASFQPISLFTNNIWDAPLLMRVIATGNSFWTMIVNSRPHMLRNFSAHSQGMKALVDTEFWSKRTIVEDGHQFWRTYFRYEGQHIVYPVFAPIYQDAVLAATYKKTLKAQFVQLRRWAWGASDIAYVAYTGFFKKNSVPKKDLLLKLLRLIEGHLSWATAALILAGAALVPVYINPSGREIFVANQLPVVASYIQTIATLGIFMTTFLTLRILPPRPKHYKRRRHVLMVLQWAFLPVVTILYNSTAAIYSQTRLMFGKYLGKFDLTEKAIKKD